MSILIKNATIINANDTQKANILIKNNKITQISSAMSDADRVIDASGKLVMPGLIDMHVHFRDPGQEYKEDIITGSRAAAAGGVTTACCMANTKPVNDNPLIAKYMIQKAKDCGLIDLYPISAITQGSKGERLVDMGKMLEAGCIAFSDDGLPVVSSDVMRAALEYSAHHGSFIINHSQDCSLCRCGHMNEGQMSMKLGIKGMPREQEEIMISRDLLLAKQTGGRIHTAHISSAWSLELVKMARQKGINITCEVTPHHFTYDETALENYDTSYKMSPPLRTKADVEAMKAGLKSGVIDVIATDHAPHSKDEKNSTFEDAPFGITGLQTLVPLTLNLVREGVLSYEDMVRVCSKRPAEILGLDDRGEIAVGKLADIAIIDPNIEYIFDEKLNFSKSVNSPLFGKTLKGANVLSIKSGKIVYEWGKEF